MDAQVAIVIVNWNGGGHLRACLQALAAQTWTQFRAVVVDNASSDGSQAAVAELGDSRIQLLQLDSNTGFARGSNLGVRACGSCEFIALLNPDTMAHPEWLQRLLDAAAAHPEVASFGSHLVDAQHRELSDGTGDMYHFSGRAWRRDHGVPVASSVDTPGDIFSACAAAALYRRSAWDEARGLDENFFCYLEDVDLGFRLRLMGWRALHVPQSLCYHAASSLTGRRSDFSTYHGQRNMVWTFVKNMPPALFWLLAPVHILLNLLAPFALALRGQGMVAWRAKRDALRGLPRAWAQRRELQAARRASASQIWASLDKRLWPAPSMPPSP